MSVVHGIISNNERDKMAYVSEDGNFGSDEAIIFDGDSLTDKEWEQLDWLGDNDRYNFVMNILQKKGRKWTGEA